MDRTERFYKINQLLENQRRVSFAQMQEACEVSRATLQRDLERSVEVAIKEKLDAEKSFIEYKFSSERSECGFVRPNFASIGVWVNRAIFRAQESDERRTWTLVSTRRFRRYIGTVQFEI